MCGRHAAASESAAFRRWIRAGLYTLRQMMIPAPVNPTRDLGMYLAEVHNPIEPENGMEYGYLAYHFERLEEVTAPRG
ncbi:hypothetical protein ES708_12671 [subsurface metagenome]